METFGVSPPTWQLAWFYGLRSESLSYRPRFKNHAIGKKEVGILKWMMIFYNEAN
jgi:hypothetical protein